MPDFDFVAPRTLDEALGILAQAKEGARCLAGGSDLIDQIRQGRRNPTVVVDVKNIAELNRLEFVPGEGLHIGAAVPCLDTYENPTVIELYPILVQCTSLIGDVKVQNRAGIGGNLCNAAPSGDTAPGVMATASKCIIAGPSGRREIPVENFFAGPGQTTMAPDELLVEILVPPPPPHSAGSYIRLIPRNEMDIAIVGVGSFVIMSGPNPSTIKEARIALAAVAPTPVRAPEAESYLVGKSLSAGTIEEAGELAAQSAKPISDMRSSKEFRTDMVKALTRKTLRECAKTLGY